MILGLVAISGMLAAEAAAPARQPPTAIEISFSTHAGEGAEGRKRFGRDGCYQVESGGGTGGAGYARDSQAGCHLPADVAAVFARLGAIPESALVREKAAVPRGGAAGGARAGGLSPGGSEEHVVLIRGDGSRWVAASKPTADDILRAVNELPSENQWYAKPPEKPIGKGAQLVVLSVTTSDNQRLQASLTSDGRWWCYRSIVGEPHGQPELPAKKPSPIPAATATARLIRIFAGADAQAESDLAFDGPFPSHWKDPEGLEAAVDVVWPGKGRSTLGLKPHLHENVLRRFVAEMKTASPTCSYEGRGR